MSSPRPDVVVLHSSAGIYGADRLLLEDLRILRTFDAEVRLVIPEAGPLAGGAAAAGVDVVVDPRLVVLRRVEPRLRLPANWPASARHARLRVLNTLAMGAYLPLSRIRPGGIPTTLFVHELLLDTTRHAFRFLIALSGVPVVANSRATADWLVGLRVPDARISVMYPMLPSEFGQHAEQSRREGPLPGERFVIACIGRINGKKGQELLLRAAEECSTPVELVFAGGPYRGQEHHHEALLAAATRSPVPVTYLGEVADVAPVMSTAHAVAVPSLTPEPFGIVALEAATLGIPLILARHGGLVEIGERAPSVMFTPASLTGLANAIDIVAASYDDLLAREPAPDLAAIAGGQQRRAAWKTMLAELVV